MNPRVILASLHLITTTGFIPGKTALTLMNDFIQESSVACFSYVYVDYLNLNKIKIKFIYRTGINVLHSLYWIYVFLCIIVFLYILQICCW